VKCEEGMFFFEEKIMVIALVIIFSSICFVSNKL